MFLSLQLLAEHVALYLDVEVCNHILDQVSLLSGLFPTVLGSYVLVLTVTNSETNFQTILSFILFSSFGWIWIILLSVEQFLPEPQAMLVMKIWLQNLHFVSTTAEQQVATPAK